MNTINIQKGCVSFSQRFYHQKGIISQHVRAENIFPEDNLAAVSCWIDPGAPGCTLPCGALGKEMRRVCSLHRISDVFHLMAGCAFASGSGLPGHLRGLFQLGAKERDSAPQVSPVRDMHSLPLGRWIELFLPFPNSLPCMTQHWSSCSRT